MGRFKIFDVKNKRTKLFTDNIMCFKFLLSSAFDIRRMYWNREKSSTSGFEGIYRFSEVFNKISLFLQNVCLRHKFFGHARAKTNRQSWMKFYIYLHLNINSCRLYFGAYCLRSSAVARNL